MKTLLAIVALLAGLLASYSVGHAGETYQDAGATWDLGGQLITDNGRLTYTVLPESYLFTNTIRLRYISRLAISMLERPADTTWVGLPFTLELKEWDSGSFVSLRKNATLTIHYRPEELGGRSESTLRVTRFFDSWVDMPGTVDTVNHTVTIQVPYGGNYGLLASDVGTTWVAAPTATPAASPASAPTPTASADTTIPMLSTVKGRTFYDKNGNGTFDGDDFPVWGAKLRISSPTWSAETMSGPDGSYAFWGLRGSSYTMDLIVGPEWAFTTPSSVANLRVTGDGDTATADFGMWYKLPGT